MNQNLLIALILVVLSFLIAGCMTIPTENQPEKNETENSNVPNFSFSYSPTSGIPPLKVTFEIQSNDPTTTWKWNWGDGSTSLYELDSHTYGRIGNYSVSLTGTNQYGNKTVLGEQTILAVSPYSKDDYIFDNITTEIIRNVPDFNEKIQIAASKNDWESMADISAKFSSFTSIQKMKINDLQVCSQLEGEKVLILKSLENYEKGSDLYTKGGFAASKGDMGSALSFVKEGSIYIDSGKRYFELWMDETQKNNIFRSQNSPTQWVPD